MKFACGGDWDDRVLGYDTLAQAERAEVDAHVAMCRFCQALRVRFEEVDQRMDALGLPVRAPDAFGERVTRLARNTPRMTPRPPTWIPELLDGIGWAAAFWVGAFLVRQLL